MSFNDYNKDIFLRSNSLDLYENIDQSAELNEFYLPRRNGLFTAISFENSSYSTNLKSLELDVIYKI